MHLCILPESATEVDHIDNGIVIQHDLFVVRFAKHGLFDFSLARAKFWRITVFHWSPKHCSHVIALTLRELEKTCQAATNTTSLHDSYRIHVLLGCVLSRSSQQFRHPLHRKSENKTYHLLENNNNCIIIMKSTSISILLSVFATYLLSSTSAFVVQPSVVVVPSATTTTSLNVFGNKKSQAQKATEETQYWQGEWVCKDCGYIYNRVSGCLQEPIIRMDNENNLHVIEQLYGW
jgi:hypothetical protein